MNLKEIQNLIKFVAKSGANEVKLEMEDVKITIKTGCDSEIVSVQPQYATAPENLLPAMADPAATAQPQLQQTATEQNYNDGLLTITAPMIGTFYRKPSPDKPTFAEIGDTISENSVVCIIEAMKLFNEIESEVSGKIVKVLVEDSTPVEFGQPLFIVEPV